MLKIMYFSKIYITGCIGMLSKYHAEFSIATYYTDTVYS